MAHVFHRLFYHMVWSTKNREQMIEESMREAFLKCLKEVSIDRKVKPIACNAMPDHVHFLAQLPPSLCISTFVGHIKGGSSFEYNHNAGARNPIKWQDGYGVVSISERDIPKVTSYVENQQMIHASRRTLRVLEAIGE